MKVSSKYKIFLHDKKNRLYYGKKKITLTSDIACGGLNSYCFIFAKLPDVTVDDGLIAGKNLVIDLLKFCFFLGTVDCRLFFKTFIFSLVANGFDGTRYGFDGLTSSIFNCGIIISRTLTFRGSLLTFRLML